MSQRRWLGMLGLMTLSAWTLVLCSARPAPAGDGSTAAPHARRLVYELRESKEEVRNLIGLGDAFKDRTLGALDEAISQLKTCFKDVWGDFPYIKPVDPDDYPPGEDHKHMRRALREMKAAIDELKTAKGVTDEHRDDAITALDKAAESLRAALDPAK